MSKLTALALSIAILGGIWAYLALGSLSCCVLVWAGFIAWGCFFHAGATCEGGQKVVAGMIYGAVIAAVALTLVGSNPLGLPGAFGPAVYIAVTVFFLVIVANIDLLSVVPANVYGYAATAAYALQTPNAGSVTAIDLSNPVLLIALSAILGVIFAYLSKMLADKLAP